MCEERTYHLDIADSTKNPQSYVRLDPEPGGFVVCVICVLQQCPLRTASLNSDEFSRKIQLKSTEVFLTSSQNLLELFAPFCKFRYQNTKEKQNICCCFQSLHRLFVQRKGFHRLHGLLGKRIEMWFVKYFVVIIQDGEGLKPDFLKSCFKAFSFVRKQLF